MQEKHQASYLYQGQKIAFPINVENTRTNIRYEKQFKLTVFLDAFSISKESELEIFFVLFLS